MNDKVLVEMERALNLWTEDLNWKHMPIDSNMLWQKVLNLYEDLRKESIEEKDTKTFIASKG